MTPAETVENARLRLGYSQLGMARAMGVAPGTYKKWVSGDRQPGATAVRLALVLARHPRTANALERGLTTLLWRSTR